MDSLESFITAIQKNGKITTVCSGSPYSALFDDWQEEVGYVSHDVLDAEDELEDI